MKIFISYRRDDSADIAGRIYDYLTQPLGPFATADVFKDVDSIPFGVHFKKYLDSQVQQCHVCLVVIGPRWVDITDNNGRRRLDDPADFVRIEVESALARNIPVIPLLVAGATMPDAGKLPASLADLPFMNGATIGRDPNFKPDIARLIRGLQHMKQALQPASITSAPTPQPRRVEVVNSPTAPPKPRFTLPLLEWVDIPAGKVTLKDNLGTFEAAAFKMAKYPVTNAQFQAFIDDGGYKQDRIWKGLANRETAPVKPSWSEGTHPREMVNWYESIAFTRWLSEKTGLTVSLPTEWQWAAVGNKGWAYAYGNTFDASKCNTSESAIQKTTPVDRYPQGASQFGVIDMIGNVWEWCLNTYEHPETTNIRSDKRRVVRGGSWASDQQLAKIATRGSRLPVDRVYYFGFRVCCPY